MIVDDTVVCAKDSDHEMPKPPSILTELDRWLQSG